MNSSFITNSTENLFRLSYAKLIPIILSKLIKLIMRGTLCHKLYKLSKQIFKIAIIVRQLFLPTYGGSKTKVMFYVHHQSFKRPFRTKNGPPLMAAVHNTGIQVFQAKKYFK